MARGVYIIVNSEERSSYNSGYFGNIDDALEGLKECSDFWSPRGTGTIYYQPYGLHQARQTVFVGHGLDSKGNLKGEFDEDFREPDETEDEQELE